MLSKVQSTSKEDPCASAPETRVGNGYCTRAFPLRSTLPDPGPRSLTSSRRRPSSPLKVNGDLESIFQHSTGNRTRDDISVAINLQPPNCAFFHGRILPFFIWQDLSSRSAIRIG